MVNMTFLNPEHYTDVITIHFHWIIMAHSKILIYWYQQKYSRACVTMGKNKFPFKISRKKIHCSIKKSKSFKEDITCNKKLIKFDTAFSGSQPHQMNYKIQHFKHQLHLHHQGDVNAEVEWSLFTSPWQWRWSWSPKSWILQFI